MTIDLRRFRVFRREGDGHDRHPYVWVTAMPPREALDRLEQNARMYPRDKFLLRAEDDIHWGCSVCLYDRLKHPAENHLICPSCGTRFDHDDIAKNHRDLRRDWIAGGARWWGGWREIPDEGWEPAFNDGEREILCAVADQERSDAGPACDWMPPLAPPRDADIIRLGREATEEFVGVLLDPSPPAPALVAAMREYRENVVAPRRRAMREQILRSFEDFEYRHLFLEEEVNTGLAFQLRNTRKRRGWSRAKLAKKAGVSRWTITRLEQLDGEHPDVTARTLLKVARALDIGLIISFVDFYEVADRAVSLDSRGTTIDPWGGMDSDDSGEGV